MGGAAGGLACTGKAASANSSTKAKPHLDRTLNKPTDADMDSPLKACASGRSQFLPFKLGNTNPDSNVNAKSVNGLTLTFSEGWCPRYLWALGTSSGQL